MPEPAPVIERIAASAFRIPTDAPEADGTFNWDHATLVVAEVSAGGVAGLGYSYAGVQAAHLINDVFAAFLVGADASAIAKAWEQMFASVRNLGSRGICANAISAVDVALWDLKAKSLGRPLVDILGAAGPPSLALTEHWNYEDKKDFFGGYCYMSQGPLPQLWANTQMSAHGLWGADLIREMENYNHVVGLKIVGEMLPQERNCVTLDDELDQYGLRIPRVTYSWCDNDKRLIDHSLKFMTQALQAVDAHDIWTQEDDTCHLNGTARMGDDPRTSVVDTNCRTWDIANLWICDGSVFPTVGGVNPSLTIQAIACRTADRIKAMAARGEL